MHSRLFFHHAEIAVHEVDDEIAHGRKAQCLMPILLEELRAPTHHRPHIGVTQQTGRPHS
jgi:hypothetical protein